MTASLQRLTSSGRNQRPPPRPLRDLQTALLLLLVLQHRDGLSVLLCFGDLNDRPGPAGTGPGPDQDTHRFDRTRTPIVSSHLRGGISQACVEIWKKFRDLSRLSVAREKFWQLSGSGGVRPKEE